MALVESGWGGKPTDYVFVADVEWEDESYQFNMTRVYQHAPTGKLFYAEDSGCSCPSPFEDTTEDDLHPITRLQDWYDHVAARTITEDNDYQWTRKTPTSAIDDVETARKAIEIKLKESK